MIVRSGPPARRVRGQRLAACPQRTQVDGGRLNRTGVRAKATAGVAVRDHGALLKRSKVRPKLFVYEVLADSGTKAIKISEQSYSRKPHAVACGLNPWLPSRFNPNTSRKLLLSDPPIRIASNADARTYSQDALLGHRTLKLAGLYRN